MPLLGLTLALLTGCIVTSIYPFYMAKDVIFDTALIGKWDDVDQPDKTDNLWTFERARDQTYQLTIPDGSTTNSFDAHLFTLDGQKFLDCLTRDRIPYSAPTHLLFRINRMTPQLELQLLSYKWLGELLEKDPQAIRHIIAPAPAGDSEEKGLLVLTADTAELQTFIRKHLKNTNAWDDPIVLQKR